MKPLRTIHSYSGEQSIAVAPAVLNNAKGFDFPKCYTMMPGEDGPYSYDVVHKHVCWILFVLTKCALVGYNGYAASIIT